jgi:diaminopimelate epimerase
VQEIPFIKMHGLGNDFVIIDQRELQIDLSKELVCKISDRNRGVGCDQLAVKTLMQN